MSYEHNVTQNIIYFLTRRVDLYVPKYQLFMVGGSKGGWYDMKTANLYIPKWIFGLNCFEQLDDTYCIYYLAHELSHVYVGEQELHDHGELFYMYFRELCPKDLLYWEEEYLPENKELIYV